MNKRRKGLIKNIFLEHPKSVGETYFQHMFVALAYSLRILLAGLACAVHAIIPALLQKTASTSLEALSSELLMRSKEMNKKPDEQ